MRLGRRVGQAAPSPQNATLSAPGQVAIVLVSFAIAASVAWFLTPIIGRAAGFPLVYAAVALSTGIAGLRGGVFGLLAGLVIMATITLPRSRIGGVRNPNEPFSLIAYTVTSVLIIAAVSATRLARLRTRDARADLARANTKLEHTNRALERALEEANAAHKDAVERADRLRLLDEASSILASSLDYETTIAATARLMVPAIADWCSVDVLVEGEIKQLGAAQIETPEFRRLSEVRARSTLSPDASTGLAQVIRTGEPHFVAEVTDMHLAMQARNPEHLEAMRALGVRSAMIVPMIARRQVVGAVTLVGTHARPPFDDGMFDLARDVARRAALAIDNAGLYRKAVVANEAKSNFLATMSHELRTPLTAVIGYEELLVEGVTGPVTDAQQQQLARIKASARQLLTLIDEILLYARIEAGVESVKVAHVRAKAVVDEAMTVVLPLAHARHLSLVEDEIDSELVLDTDGGKLRQMLVNLLGNAVKFTERGEITARAFASDGDVLFEVQDTGIGIAREHLERIFEAFWQVEESRTRRIGGSGLGLSTTRQLARTLGGDVTVESQPGVGSTFRIVLPRSRPIESTSRARQRKAS
jgi:signal transduction histidine kinase